MWIFHGIIQFVNANGKKKEEKKLLHYLTRLFYRIEKNVQLYFSNFFSYFKFSISLEKSDSKFAVNLTRVKSTGEKKGARNDVGNNNNKKI